MSYYGLREFSVFTNLKARCQELIKITLVLIIKDYAILRFDFNVYNNPICKQMSTSDSNIPPGITNYLKVDLKSSFVNLLKSC